MVLPTRDTTSAVTHGFDSAPSIYTSNITNSSNATLSTKAGESDDEFSQLEELDDAYIYQNKSEESAPESTAAGPNCESQVLKSDLLSQYRVNLVSHYHKYRSEYLNCVAMARQITEGAHNHSEQEMAEAIDDVEIQKGRLAKMMKLINVDIKGLEEAIKAEKVKEGVASKIEHEEEEARTRLEKEGADTGNEHEDTEEGGVKLSNGHGN